MNDTDKQLSNFLLTKPAEISFEYSKEQSKIIQDDLDFNGDTLIGKTKALKAIPFQVLWRKAIGFENQKYSENIRSIEAKRWNTI